MKRLLRCATAMVVAATPSLRAQLPVPAGCRPVEQVTVGQRAADSVRIGTRFVPRTETAVQTAWRTLGVDTGFKLGAFRPGERVLIYRDSQPRGSAIFDGCTLVPEQLPLPTFMQPDSIAAMEILPSKSVAVLMHDRRGYQVVRITIRRPKTKSGSP